jgi:hypothetical protein
MSSKSFLSSRDVIGGDYEIRQSMGLMNLYIKTKRVIENNSQVFLPLITIIGALLCFLPLMYKEKYGLLNQDGPTYNNMLADGNTHTSALIASISVCVPITLDMLTDIYVCITSGGYNSKGDFKNENFRLILGRALIIISVFVPATFMLSTGAENYSILQVFICSTCARRILFLGCILFICSPPGDPIWTTKRTGFIQLFYVASQV